MKKLLLIIFFIPLLARAQTIIKIATCEYVVYFMGDDSVLYTVGGTAHPLAGGRKVLDLAGAFNKAAIAANDGSFWNSTDYTQTFALTQVTTDTLSNPVNDVDGVWAYADAVFIRRKTDSSVWAVNNDSIGLYHALGTRYIITKPIKLTQSGVKYKKMVPCGDGLYGLTNDGKIYYWARNSQSITPSLIWAGSPKCLDIASATYNAVIAIMQNATGDPTCGRPYAKGISWGDWGGTSVTYSSFTDISSILQMPYSVKKVCMSTNSLHFIDSLGQQLGVAKVGSNGELGHGENYVNKFPYPTFPGFGWNSNIENPIPGPAKLVNPGVKHKELYAAGFFGLYCMSLDSSNNIDICGRNKTIAMDGSVENPTDNNLHPNALDIYIWKRITPMTTPIKTLRFVAPSFAVVGGNQTISVSSTSVTTAGNAMCLINQANSTDTVRGKASSNTHHWVQTSGPVGSTIVSPTLATTSITGLVTGTYIYKDTITDGFQGTNLAAVTVNATVSGTIPPTVSAGIDQTITLPISSTSVTGTATGNGGATITSTAWTFVSGPVTPSFGTPSSLTTTVTGMTVAGPYVIKLTANDSNGNSSFDNMQITVLPAVVITNVRCRKCRIIAH
jgi:hypothetical protein